MGRAGEEDSGHEYVGVQYDLHLWDLTLVTAALMSDLLSPACLACLRARAISSSNSSILGGEIVLRITVSFSPTTTN